MISIEQFRDFIVRPTLQCLDAWSLSAEQLVIATALAESRLQYLRQWRNGPARGFFQLEPSSHDDLWQNFLKHNPELSARLQTLIIPNMPRKDQLYGNLFYATAMCRIFYLRIPKSLPAANDWPSMAAYWKRYYNTHLGAGTTDGFLSKIRLVIKFYAEEDFS